MNKKESKYILFWIKSNRGTDQKTIFEISNDWGKKDIESALKKWCSGFGAWTSSENVINYGFKTIKVFKKEELTKRYFAICKRKNKILEQWQTLAAMFNIRKLK